VASLFSIALVWPLCWIVPRPSSLSKVSPAIAALAGIHRPSTLRFLALSPSHPFLSHTQTDAHPFTFRSSPQPPLEARSEPLCETCHRPRVGGPWPRSDGARMGPKSHNSLGPRRARGITSRQGLREYNYSEHLCQSDVKQESVDAPSMS
jgi:hypothetical protein